MDYSTIFFNKSLDLLDYQDIVDFFAEAREESTTIEFKAYSAQYGNFLKNLDGIIKGICAFLNSDGGILIWGAPKGSIPDGQDKKIFQGALSPLIEIKEKDWLINKISDLITPLPIGVNVKILRNEDAIIYIFEIQKSNYSPHQFQNIYFARLDGQTKPAPHYLIDALFKKIRYPNIEGFIKLEDISRDNNNYFLDITIFLFNFSQLQNEENLSFRLLCPQGTFVRALHPSFEHMYSVQGHELVFKDLIDVLHFGAPNMHSERLSFNPYAVMSNSNNEVDFILSFGGKFSPLKTSSYKLNFGAIDWNKTKEPNYLFFEIEENYLVIEKQKELGATRESTLKSILKR